MVPGSISHMTRLSAKPSISTAAADIPASAPISVARMRYQHQAAQYEIVKSWTRFACCSNEAQPMMMLGYRCFES